MKTCPTCNRSFTDEALNFCLQDGAALVIAAGARSASAMPAGVSRPNPGAPTAPPGNQSPAFPAQYAQRPPAQQRKSNAVWWILGGLAALLVLGIGAVVVILALLSLDTGSNKNDSVTDSAKVSRDGGGSLRRMRWL